jgi:hypothetical protein
LLSDANGQIPNAKDHVDAVLDDFRSVVGEPFHAEFVATWIGQKVLPFNKTVLP